MVRFCDRCINKRSRTHDQMVQAARSGVQNIAEGSQARRAKGATDDPAQGTALGNQPTKTAKP